MDSILGLSFYVVLGTLGGFLGSRLKITGGALIGAMLTIIFVKMLLKVHWEVPKSFTFILQVFLGVMIGATFQPDMVKTLIKIIIPVITSTVILVGAGIILSIIFTKLNLLDPSTAYLGTSPGAMSALIVLAIDNPAKEALVVCFHFFRVVFIILTAPIILKYLSG